MAQAQGSQDQDQGEDHGKIIEAKGARAGQCVEKTEW